MTAAVIDLGTNTFHLIIAEVSGSAVNILYKTNVPVRLGEGKINENIIIPTAFERGINTLKSFSESIEAYNATAVRAIATSAVRSATNGLEFVKAAKENAGIDIEIITGDQEAEYIFSGVKATGIVEDLSLIMDIGGGSTEFIICNRDQLLWKKSYDIGAARLMQAYFRSDPINEQDKAAINDRLDQELKDLIEVCKLHQPKMLVGSAGAFETFATMIIKDLDLKSIKATSLDLKAYQILSGKLIGATHSERDAMDGLIKLRVDMIVIASILTNYIIERCGIKQISLSTYDLKMGVLHTLGKD